MITGFNPADMYAVDHIRRVLQTFPGVFSGIGEFTIHKEFVSAKVAGGEPSLANPALDRIFAFAGEAGLSSSFTTTSTCRLRRRARRPVYLRQMRELLLRHPETTVIWAHAGLGRVVHPVQSEASAARPSGPRTSPGSSRGSSREPTLTHLHFDISWSEVAKYVVATPAVHAARGAGHQRVSRTASSSAPTRWRRPTRTRIFASIASTIPCGSC